MKKLIATLGIIGLIASTSTTVVSCSLINNTKLGLEKKVNELAAVTAAALRPAIAQSVTNRSSKDLWTHLSHLKASDAISGINANDERNVSDILTNESQFSNLANVETLKNIKNFNSTDNGMILNEKSKRLVDPKIKTISNLLEIVLNLFASQGGFKEELANTISPAIDKVGDVLGLGSSSKLSLSNIIDLPSWVPSEVVPIISFKHLTGEILDKFLDAFWAKQKDKDISVTLTAQQFSDATGIEVSPLIMKILINIINSKLPSWIKISFNMLSSKFTFTFKLKIPSIESIVDYIKSNSNLIDFVASTLISDNSLKLINRYLELIVDFSKDDIFPNKKNPLTIGNYLKTKNDPTEENNFSFGLVNLLEFMFKPLDKNGPISVYSKDEDGKEKCFDVHTLLSAFLSFVTYKVEKFEVDETNVKPIQLLGFDVNNDKKFYGYKSKSDTSGADHGTLFNGLNLLFNSKPMIALMSESGLNIFKTINKKIAENENTFFTPLIDERNFIISNIKHNNFDVANEDSKLTFDIKFTNPIYDQIIALGNKEVLDGLIYKEGKFEVEVIGPKPQDGELQPYMIESIRELYKK